MSQWKIELESKPDPKDVRFVIGQLEAFNEKNSPTPFERRDVRLFVRDDEAVVQAGLFASVTMHTLVIQIMWVHEKLRHQGLGRELIDRAEAIARDHGVRQAIVETTSFQAPEFYRKMGYTVICEIQDSPIGASSFLMRKDM